MDNVIALDDHRVPSKRLRASKEEIAEIEMFYNSVVESATKVNCKMAIAAVAYFKRRFLSGAISFDAALDKILDFAAYVADEGHAYLPMRPISRRPTLKAVMTCADSVHSIAHDMGHPELAALAKSILDHWTTKNEKTTPAEIRASLTDLHALHHDILERGYHNREGGAEFENFFTVHPVCAGY